jgi:hypothetical protein
MPKPSRDLGVTIIAVSGFPFRESDIQLQLRHFLGLLGPLRHTVNVRRHGFGGRRCRCSEISYLWGYDLVSGKLYNQSL